MRSKGAIAMRKPYPATIYAAVGLTAFGVGYDSGLFGTPDGHNHSAPVSFAVAGATGASVSNVHVTNNITGDEVVFPLVASGINAGQTGNV